MIVRQAELTILSAPVPLCDRRALSEAWYSALHLHIDKSRLAPAPKGGRAWRASTQRGRQANESGVAKKAPVPTLNRAVRVGAALAFPGAPQYERRTPPSRLARKIERAFAAPSSPRRHAAFSLEGARGRVQILLRQRGRETQIIALCAPAARDAVAQALTQARYALALRGIVVDAEIRGFAS
ncbi:MAG: hypothetical protein NVS9B12_03780 [Vulcanimicrobiaceae bacterium]